MKAEGTRKGLDYTVWHWPKALHTPRSPPPTLSQDVLGLGGLCPSRLGVSGPYKSAQSCTPAPWTRVAGDRLPTQAHPASSPPERPLSLAQGPRAQGTVRAHCTQGETEAGSSHTFRITQQSRQSWGGERSSGPPALVTSGQHKTGRQGGGGDGGAGTHSGFPGSCGELGATVPVFPSPLT